MIVNNLMRLDLEKGYIDLIDDRITVINNGEKTTIMKSDIIEVKTENFNTKTASNNIRVGTRIAPHTYVSKSFDIGSKAYTMGELIIHYNNEDLEDWIYFYDSNATNVNAINCILNEWLNGSLIPSEKVRDYNERKKTLKFKIEYYLPMVLFILLGVWVIHKVATG